TPPEKAEVTECRGRPFPPRTFSACCSLFTLILLSIHAIPPLPKTRYPARRSPHFRQGGLPCSRNLKTSWKCFASPSSVIPTRVPSYGKKTENIFVLVTLNCGISSVNSK